jgi:glycosyltransferase involved in cell wall biosynthesis
MVLFPGGIRPLKNPRFPLRPLERLRARHPALSLVYAGPILDADEGQALAHELAGRPWARHVGGVPHGDMPAWFSAADVVLNCSESEGGMANAVLEALALGRAVLVSAIAGNRSLVEDGVTGLLYASEAEFEDKADRLLADGALRRRLGEGGRRLVESQFPPGRELDGYLTVYAQVAPALRIASGIDGA